MERIQLVKDNYSLAMGEIEEDKEWMNYFDLGVDKSRFAHTIPAAGLSRLHHGLLISYVGMPDGDVLIKKETM